MSHDPGDEHARAPRWTHRTGPVQCYYPMRWFKELVPTPPEHDPGDEEPRWEPLSDVSNKRLEHELLGRPTAKKPTGWA